MDANTNQEKFWLAWDATCAGAACVDAKRIETGVKDRCRENPEIGERFAKVIGDLDGTVKLAGEMIKSTNQKFREALSYFHSIYNKKRKRNSDYDDEVANWNDAMPSMGCALSVVEGSLYAKESIKGRPVKEYLLESVGNRSGSLSANLYGYIKQTIRSIVRDSFSKCSRREEKIDDEGHVVEDDALSTEMREDILSLSPSMQTDIKMVCEYFREYVNALGRATADEPSVWDQDNWISLYCAINQIPINNPDVRRLCRRGHTALAAVYNGTVGNLLLVMRKKYKVDDRVIAWAFGCEIPSVLDEMMCDMPFHAALEQIRLSRDQKSECNAEKHA